MAKPRGLAYFDTSALVKRYVIEAGSARVKRLLQTYRVLSSVITPLELSSAFKRRHSMRDLAEDDYSAVLAAIQRDRDHWELIELAPLVLSTAEELASELNVRTLDAIHLGSAVSFQVKSGIDVPFITADEKQGQTARAMNLEAIGVK